MGEGKGGARRDGLSDSRGDSEQRRKGGAHAGQREAGDRETTDAASMRRRSKSVRAGKGEGGVRGAMRAVGTGAGRERREGRKRAVRGEARRFPCATKRTSGRYTAEKAAQGPCGLSETALSPPPRPRLCCCPPPPTWAGWRFQTRRCAGAMPTASRPRQHRLQRRAYARRSRRFRLFGALAGRFDAFGPQNPTGRYASPPLPKARPLPLRTPARVFRPFCKLATVDPTRGPGMPRHRGTHRKRPLVRSPTVCQRV